MSRGLRSLSAGAALCATLAAATSPGRTAELPKPLSEEPHLGACGIAGGFLLPGTAACLRIGGSVAAEGAWRIAAPTAAAFAIPPAGAPHAATAFDHLDRSGLGVGARLSADMRIPTELGPVRVYVSLRGRNGVATDHPAR